MNNAKVTVTKEVAEAIEVVKAKYGIYGALVQVEGAIYSEPEITVKRWVTESDNMSYDILAEMLVNGYTVEKSPEEKVREYYDRCIENRRLARSGGRGYAEENHDGQAIGASITLDILGIKIEGVNA